MRIVMLLFPNMTALDLVGPAQVFSHIPGLDLDLASHSLEPVATDAGFSLLPTSTFTYTPMCDLLFVPGGEGVFDLLGEPAVLNFLQRQAAGAQWLTSVCTGLFLLAAAGLLRGRRATTHWAWFPLLYQLDVVPVNERVVRDGTIITGAGVTSGLDFALSVVAELFGDAVARHRQLTLEYAPRPPFDAGGPDRPDTDPAAVSAARALMSQRWGPAVAAAAAQLSRT
jgi:cyclohexyl-isocyanide hydratase